MGLLDNLQKPVHRLPCKIRTVIAGLDSKDATKLTEAVMDAGWPAQTLETELGKLGVEVSATSIRKHRSKTCSCWKN